MDYNIDKYMNLILENSELIANAANDYGNFSITSEDENYIQDMMYTGYTESPSILAAYGGIKIFNDSIYSSTIESFKKSVEASKLSNEDFDFLMMFGISNVLLTRYRRKKANNAYYETFYDKDAIEQFISRNNAGEHAYDEMATLIPDGYTEMIATIVNYQNSKNNNVSK